MDEPRNLLANLRALQRRQRATIEYAAARVVDGQAELNDAAAALGASELQVRLLAQELLADHQADLEQLELAHASAKVSRLIRRGVSSRPGWINGGANRIVLRLGDDDGMLDLSDDAQRDKITLFADALILLQVADLLADQAPSS